MTKNVIQLNGNTYDIRSGKRIGSEQTSNGSGAGNGSSYVDGYIKPQKQQQRPNQIPQNPAKKPVEKSQTLMRSAVSKPNQQTTSTEEKHTSRTTNVQKRSIVDFGRIERAARSAKSSAIKKFHPVQHEPATHQDRVKQDKPATGSTPVHTVAAQSVKRGAHKQQNPMQNRKRALEQNALARATSHEKTHDTNGTKQSFVTRWWQALRNAPTQFRYAAAGLLMIGGLAVIGYVSTPYVSVRIASSRSNVNASLPAYKPAGFELNRSVEYSPEHVALQYDSVSDSRTFRIKKEQTNWTSESLRTSFVETKGLYQTIASNGKTIYIYNNSNATWVDGGVWYNIEGASSLNSDQLLRLANSL